MSIKDLFKKSPSKVLAGASANSVGSSVESEQYVEAFLEDRDRFDPPVDYSNPAHFVRFGSAKKYYEDAIQRITSNYPFDGSLKERVEYHNSSSLLDRYTFKNIYPRTNGYVRFSPTGWGTQITSSDNGFGNPASKEYINIKGGPNAGPNGTRVGANIYDASNEREWNLRFGGAKGNTVEFWLKKDAVLTGSTTKEVVFDLHNGHPITHSATSHYGRFMVLIDGAVAASDDPFFKITYVSGNVSACTEQALGSTDGLASSGSLLDDTFNHYAISTKNSGSNLILQLYVNGAHNDTRTVVGGAINQVTGALEANIGSLLTQSIPTEVPAAALGWGKLSGSIDEFRFWKTRRSSRDIGRYWFGQLGGGTNTDLANKHLGVYYKFNEGITGLSIHDSVVLDYSGRLSHGTWTGYNTSSVEHRATGSAIIEAAAARSEFKDPIIYAAHPLVSASLAQYRASGSAYDDTNNAAFVNSFAGWIIDDDEEAANLTNLTQIMASFFDDLYLKIEYLPKLKWATYNTASFKALPFSRNLLESVGFVTSEIFADASTLNALVNRDENRTFEDQLVDVKNTIYQNIYNNVAFLYKSKGTEKAFRNLFRCYGIDDRLVKLNLYADNTTYEFKDNFRSTAVKDRHIDFNNVDRYIGTVYQYRDSTNANSVSFISGSSLAESGSALTVETEVWFPKRFKVNDDFFVDTPFITASLFGMHTAQTSNVDDTTWAAADVGNFQVQVVRDQLNSRDVYFQFTGSSGGYFPLLTSSLYRDVYDNERWVFAVRVKPTKYPFVDGLSGSVGTYDVVFYGVNTVADVVQNEFVSSASVSAAQAQQFMSAPKRMYVGAHWTNFTSSLLQRTDVKVGAARVWMDYLEDLEIQAHAKDADNYGRMRPHESAYLWQNPSGQYVPRSETLALHWSFANVTASGPGTGALTSDATFLVEDVASGSTDLTARYDWLGNIVNLQHTGRGDKFIGLSNAVVDHEYVMSARQKLPEVIDSGDMIEILSTEDDDQFTRDHRPIKHYFAIEKSMYQTISEEMVNVFASIVAFNNLIGEPVNRYRPEYKHMAKLRQLFFEAVQNTPDVQKYIEFYKWIDSSLTEMASQLIPASANFSRDLRNVIESHVLERSKYQSKFPTLEVEAATPNAGAQGINRHLYNWRLGHRPLSGLQDENQLYWKELAEREDSPIATGIDAVDDDRAQVLTASVSALTRKWTTPHHLAVGESRQAKGGVAHHPSKKSFDYTKAATSFGDVSAHRMQISASSIDIPSARDVEDPNRKVRLSGDVTNDHMAASDYNTLDSNAALPFDLYSASINGGVNDHIAARFKSDVDITNIHEDRYGSLHERPAQGPFTEKHVGGLQHRHVALNDGTDTNATRPEGFKIHANAGLITVGAADSTSPSVSDTSLPRATHYRDETAKRPLNIQNHQGIGGNYTSSYEIVQTSGRSINNRALVASASAAFQKQEIPSTYITGVVDFTKMLRDREEHIIVERFSAPGGVDTSGDFLGGHGLDFEAAEKSVYNALPWRNLLVRQPLQTLLTQHQGQFGVHSVYGNVLAASYETSASFHAVNRNACERIEAISESYAVKTTYDNWYIQHSIPQCDVQYRWISASFFTAPYGYATSSDSIVFVSSSELSSFLLLGERSFAAHPGDPLVSDVLPFDFVGLRTHVVDPISASANMLGFPDLTAINSTINTFLAKLNYINSTWISSPSSPGYGVYNDGSSYPQFPGVAAAFHALMLNRNGPYEYPSWKQIRNAEHPVVRAHRRSNIISVVIPPSEQVMVSNGQRRVAKASKGTTLRSYVEPVVSSRYKPLVHNIITDNDGKRAPLRIKHSYGNNLGTIANTELTNFLGVAKCDKQFYDKLVSMYVSPASAENPLKEFRSLSYRENIYPKETNAYLGRTRGRELYTCNFWRDARGTRNQVNTSGIVFSNSLGFEVKRQSRWPLDAGHPGAFGASALATGAYASEGELQNNYTTFFGVDTAAPWNAPGSDYNEVPGFMGSLNPAVMSFNEHLSEEQKSSWDFFASASLNGDNGDYQDHIIIGTAAEWGASFSGPIDVSVWINVTSSLTGTVPGSPTPSERPDFFTLLELGDGDLWFGLITGSAVDEYRLGVRADFNTTDPLYMTHLSPISTNTWHHVTFQYDYSSTANTASFFVDGAQVATHVHSASVGTFAGIAGTSTIASSSMSAPAAGSFGRGLNATPYEGLMSDLTIFGSNNTFAQVVELYNGGIPKSIYRHSNVENVVSWYRLGGGIGAVGATGICDGAGFLPGYNILGIGAEMASDTANGTATFSKTNAIFDMVGRNHGTASATMDRSAGSALGLPAFKTGTGSLGLRNSAEVRGAAWADCFAVGCLYHRRTPEFTSTPWPTISITASAPVSNETERDVRVTGNYVFAGDTRWTAHLESGRRPFYGESAEASNGDFTAALVGAYEKFAADLRTVGKDHTIVPEFRISEHMAHYIDDQGGNFLAENPSILTITGAATHNSTTASFFKEYSHTDFMKYFEVIKTDHEDIGDPETLTLRCSALLKFLPYDGFYPATRTTQLASLFSQSYGDHITARGHGGAAAVTGALRAFTQPFFGPGILYNAIKAGMAVDHPIYNGDSPRTIEDFKSGVGDVDLTFWSNPTVYLQDSASYGVSSIRTSRGVFGSPMSASINRWFTTCDNTFFPLTHSAYDQLKEKGFFVGENPIHNDSQVEWTSVLCDVFPTRVPFEGLVEPENWLAKKNIWDMNPEHSASLRTNLADKNTNQAVHWGGAGSAKYKLAMHNFLAEVPNFFLKEGNFTTFASKPIPPEGVTINASDADKVFAMDVYITNSDIRSNSDWHARRSLPQFRDATAYHHKITLSEMQQVKGIHTQMYSRDSAFGPPWVLADTHFTSSRTARSYHYGYEPFTPAYFNGFGLARILFHPFKGAGRYTLDEIQSHVTTSFVRFPTDRTGLFGTYLTDVYMDWMSIMSVDENANFAAESMIDTTFDETVPKKLTDAFISASSNFMQITASINLFGKTKVKKVIYERGEVSDFEVVSIEDAEDTAPMLWTIQPKWETPILNFFNKTASLPDTHTSSAGVNSLAKGMWHQYGAEPVNNEGIYFGVADLPSAVLDSSGKSCPFLPKFGYDVVGCPPFNNRSEHVIEHKRTNAEVVLYIRQVSGLATKSIVIDGATLTEGIHWAVTASNAYASAESLAREGINGNPTLGADRAIYDGSNPSTVLQHRFTASAFIPETTPFGPNDGTMAAVRIRVWNRQNRLAFEDPFSNEGSNPIGYPDYYAAGSLGNKLSITISDNSSMTNWILEGTDKQGTTITSNSVYFAGGKTPRKKAASLASLVGFSKTEKKLGQIAEEKIVREAVVAVPFIERRGVKKFFKIKRGLIDQALGLRKRRGREAVPGDSIRQMVETMKNYVLPPRMDFVTNREIAPFAMYIFEFEHTLTKQDLKDIWQNLAPESAFSFSRQESAVSHRLLRGEVLEEIGDNLRWMVFKIKQRAEKNYFAKTADSSDDTRFKFVFDVGGQSSAQDAVPNYSYNWPYDFFSLIELVKLESEIDVVRRLPDGVVEATSAKDEGTLATTQAALQQNAITQGTSGLITRN